MTWDDYYERFFDLSLSTQKSYSYKLTSYGDAEEVFEVLSEFAFYDKQFATRFASKAVDSGVHFSPDHVLEMALLVDKPAEHRQGCGSAADSGGNRNPGGSAASRSQSRVAENSGD